MTDTINEQSTPDYDREAARICGLEANRLYGHREALALEKVLKDCMTQRADAGPQDVSVQTNWMMRTIQASFSIRGAEELTGFLIHRGAESVIPSKEARYKEQKVRDIIEERNKLRNQLASRSSELEHAERTIDAIGDLCQDTGMPGTGIVRNVQECVNAYKMNRDINDD